MNHYELLAIVSGRFAETEVGEIYTKIEDLVKKSTSAIHYRQPLDRKRLAYPINNQLFGYYFLMEFDAETSTIAQVNNALRLWPDILRHHIITKKTAGKPLSRERKNSLEQEAFGKQDAKRMGISIDEAIAGAQVATPVPAANAQSVQFVAEKPIEHVAVSVAAYTESPANEEVASEEKTESASRKKQQKVSYKDLDKKLDEILGNDIL